MVLFTHQAFSQSKSAAFNSIDWKIRSVEVATPDTLAKRLTISCGTDLEKVRAISVDYGEYCISVKGPRGASKIDSKFSAQEDMDDSIAPLKPLNERVSDIVLKRKTAVCDGYARLLKPCSELQAFVRGSYYRICHRTNIK